MSRRWIGIVLVLASWAGGPLVWGDARDDLGTCATRLGDLMVDHWLTVDLSRQIDRALFYQRQDGRNDRYNRLKDSIAATQAQLERAYGLFTTLHDSKATDASELSQSLDEIRLRNARDEKGAEALLAEVGRAVNHGQFQAILVPGKALEPGWDPALIGKDHRPKRILFGNTARPGDDRILSLKFDFANGLGSLGPVAPMASPDKLDLPPDQAARSSPEYAWMKEHKVGYHYWAGVYNNQNTYAAPWFRQRFGTDDDVWMKLVDGTLLKSDGDWAQLNVWNPHVRQYIQQYAAAQAKTLKDDPFLVCYDYAGEPHPFGAQAPGKPQYSGYNASAIAAFRGYLHKKFQTIEALNRSWKASYPGFDAIQPPPDPYVTPRIRATALSYEFERFRWDSETAYFKLVYDAYRKNDPAKPIEANVSQYLSGWPVEALDAYGLQKAGAVDWADMHMNNFWPNLPEQVYLYSICRLTGKVPVQFEYVWTFPRTGPVDDKSESDFRATCEASIWRNLTWGRKVLVFFDMSYDWPAYHNAFLDSRIGYSILRPSACVIPTAKRKALRFNDVLMNTEVVAPPIVVMQPTTSILNSPPVHPHEGFSYHADVAGHAVHDLLFPKNYPFLYVPEEAVLDDGYALAKHKVIILPEAPYLPEAMTQTLLEWVRQGGTLISVGVPGIWNAYGQDDLRLVTRVFGPSRVTDAQPGKWQWVWQPLAKRPGMEMVQDPATGTVLAAKIDYGKGSVLMAPDRFDAPLARKLFYQTLDRAIVRRPARCDKDAFELVLREDHQGRQYLFVLNPDTRERREAAVTLAGRYAHCVDLGVGSGVPVQAVIDEDQTTLRLRLEPGEGTAIDLTR